MGAGNDARGLRSKFLRGNVRRIMKRAFYPALILLGACVLSCTQAAFIEDDSNEVLEYFEEVAGFEYSSDGLVRRFESDIRLYIYGQNFSFELLQELRSIIDELNELIGIGISLSITADPEEANLNVYFMTEEEYLSLFPTWKEAIAKNFGHYNAYNAGQAIGSGRIFVDTKRASIRYQRHLLREELTQVMGLGRDSPKYVQSVFYDGHVGAVEYLWIDKELVRLMYHPCMESGVSLERAVELAGRILRK